MDEVVYSTFLRSGRTRYSIDIRKQRNGREYLWITEHRTDKDGKKDRRVIRIFAESCLPFSKAVAEAVSAIQQKEA